MVCSEPPPRMASTMTTSWRSRSRCIYSVRGGVYSCSGVWIRIEVITVVTNDKEKRRFWDRKYYWAHQERIKARTAKWKKDHLEQEKATHKKWLRANKRKVLWFSRRQMYGITRADYKQLLVEQNGECCLCHRLLGEDGLGIDHDHETGVVRGLLCHYCNLALGHYERLIRKVGSVNLEAYLRRGKTWMR